MKKTILFLFALIQFAYGQTVVAPKQGGTGVNNGTKTITLATPLSWPANGSGVLQNNGAGALTWAAMGSSNWMLDGNTVGAEKWLGTVDNFDLPFRTNNVEKIRLKNNGHLVFASGSDIYDFNDNIAVDLANKQLSTTGVLTVDWGNTQLKDASGVSIHWTNRTAISLLGNTNINWAQSFTQINGTSADIDMSGSSGNDLRIAGDPDGTVAKGFYLKAFNTVGNWRTGIKYLNQATAYPDLILQPDGGDVYTNRYIKNITTPANQIDFGYNGGSYIVSSTEAGVSATNSVVVTTAVDHHITGTNSGRKWTITGDSLSFYESANGIGNIFRVGHGALSGYTQYSAVATLNSDIGVERLGIGTIAPDTTLHIVGSPKFVTGNQGTDKVLQSDANGLASWGAVITSGSYTPTVTGTSNVSSTTAYGAQYMRVGNVVTVSGKYDVDPTSTSTLTQLTISLPIASDFTLSEQCGGTSAATNADQMVGAIFASTGGDNALVSWLATDVTAQTMYYTFTYKIN